MVRARRETLPKVSLEDMADYTESQNWLLYGETGSGKTPWASLQPKTLIIACDNQGTISAKRAGSAAKVFRVYRWQDMEAIYKYLRSNPNKFNWVMVDTITMAQTRLLRSILERDNKKNPAKRSLYIPGIDQHQMWQNMLKNWVTDFNELPFNMVWTAQEMERENAEGNPVVWPLLPGGKHGFEMAAWLVAQMHVIGRVSVSMQGKGNERRAVRKILLDKRPPYQARDRFGVLPKTAILRDGDKDRTTFASLTKLIEEAPPEVKRLAAKRVAERDDDIGLDDSVDPDEATARPKRTTRRRRTA